MAVPLQRLQVLVRPDQAELLRKTARERGIPVTQIVREALDASLGGRSPEQREADWERFEALPVVPGAPDPVELERLLDDRSTDHRWLPA